MPASFPPILLSIAGSDPSGGAGLQADLKTFAAFGCHGMAAPTAITVQNRSGVHSVHPLDPALVRAQIHALFAEFPIAAVKIGMLATPEIAEIVAEALREAGAQNIVLDPVLAASRGAALATEGLAEAIGAHLLPLATLVTPNLGEAAALTGTARAAGVDEMTAQGRALLATGARAVLIKGGHLSGAPVDVLCAAGGVRLFHGGRIATANAHGTGCALSSAIAAGLARGATLPEAAAAAKTWLEGALAAGADAPPGGGLGAPLHFFELWRDR